MKSKKKELTLKGLPREEIRKLALDIRQGVVFTHRQCENDHLLKMVFMPLAFGVISKKRIEQVGLIYEYMNKAGPRSINGMPMFFSCRLLPKEDLPLLDDYLEKFQAAEKSVE